MGPHVSQDDRAAGLPDGVPPLVLHTAGREASGLKWTHPPHCICESGRASVTLSLQAPDFPCLSFLTGQAQSPAPSKGYIQTQSTAGALGRVKHPG